MGGTWFWIGVNNIDYTYLSSGLPVTISPIPWYTGQPSSSSSSTCITAQTDTLNWYATKPCTTTNGFTICEAIPVRVRLGGTGSSASEGYVEAFGSNDQWGGVCDDSF